MIYCTFGLWVFPLYFSQKSFDQLKTYFNVTWSVVRIRPTERNNAITDSNQTDTNHIDTFMKLFLHYIIMWVGHKIIIFFLIFSLKGLFSYVIFRVERKKFYTFSFDSMYLYFFRKKLSEMCCSVLHWQFYCLIIFQFIVIKNYYVLVRFMLT